MGEQAFHKCDLIVVAVNGGASISFVWFDCGGCKWGNKHFIDVIVVAVNGEASISFMWFDCGGCKWGNKHFMWFDCGGCKRRHFIHVILPWAWMFEKLATKNTLCKQSIRGQSTEQLRAHFRCRIGNALQLQWYKDAHTICTYIERRLKCNCSARLFL